MSAWQRRHSAFAEEADVPFRAPKTRALYLRYASSLIVVLVAALYIESTKVISLYRAQRDAAGLPDSTLIGRHGAGGHTPNDDDDDDERAISAEK